jgi:gamma-butyrobetaine dioxygenase
MPILEITETPQHSVRITLDNGARIDLHPLWLRERCNAATSIDGRTRQRIVDISALPADLCVTACRWSASGELVVRFSDDHESRFDRTQLLAQATMTPMDDGVPSPIPWTSELTPLPEASWASSRDLRALSEITAQFLRRGFVILHDVPCTDRQVYEIAEAFGDVRATQFGRHIDMQSTSEEIAHSPLHAASHTDFPYRIPVPGIQILHCLRNRATEESSTLADGMAIAQALAERQPRAFETLTRLSVRFNYSGPQHELVGWRPHISLDCAGRFQAIHLSAGLDFAPLLPRAELSEYYDAKRKLREMTQSEEFLLRLPLRDGDVLMLDNRRLLHGGTSFDPQLGEVHHQYCFIDSEGPRNLYRTLRRNLQDT